jgi:hypothetical protein
MPYLVAILILLNATARADTTARQPATLTQDYTGMYSSEYNAQFDRVRILVRQAQVEVSSRLGLIQYQEGFQYPMTIRFQDSIPPGLESALAYVSLGQSTTSFQQEMVINLPVMVAHPTDFDTVFYHEMTHAVMNDAVGGEASLKIPHWLQEGLAIYVSGEGDQRVRLAAEKIHKAEAPNLVFDLNEEVKGAAYPQYYLAVKYILDRFSINAVQGIVRELIEGKSLDAAFLDCTGLPLEAYKKEVKVYSLKIFRDIAKSDAVPFQGSQVPHLNHF